MLVRTFRQNQPIVLFLVVPLTLALWPGGGPWAGALPTGMTGGMPLFTGLVALATRYPWTWPVLSMLVVMGLALQVDRTANESELFERRNHLPALLLPLLLALFPNGLALDPALAGMPFVIWALRKLWGSQGKPNVLGSLFDAGLLLGLATLCHLPYLCMMVVVHSSIAVMRPFSWREHVVTVLGVGTMLFIAWSFAQLFNGHGPDPATLLTHAEPKATAQASHHWFYRSVLATLTVLFGVAGLIAFTADYARGVMREKNTRTSFVAFTLLCTITALFGRFVEGHVPAVLVAAPLSIFLAWPLVNARRNALAEVGAWLLFGLGLWGRWLG